MSTRPAATARSAGTERTPATLLGLLAVGSGTAVLLVAAGVFGTARAGRPLIDPIAVDAITRNRVLTLTIAITAGMVLVIVGLWWTVRSVRPEVTPDVALHDSPTTIISAGALSEAVQADAETVTGVYRARVRLVGQPDRPGLRLTLSLREGVDVRQTWSELDTLVLARTREALGVTLPTAVRLELDTAARQRAE